MQFEAPPSHRRAAAAAGRVNAELVGLYRILATLDVRIADLRRSAQTAASPEATRELRDFIGSEECLLEDIDDALERLDYFHGVEALVLGLVARALAALCSGRGASQVLVDDDPPYRALAPPGELLRANPIVAHAPPRASGETFQSAEALTLAA